MDRGLLGQEASLEAARELLIAISYSEPEKVELDQAESSNEVELDQAENSNQVALDQAENSNGWIAGTVINGDRTERFRSQLISISYPPSPNDRHLCNGHA